MSYRTECPDCGGPLELAHAEVAVGPGVLIRPDGFDLTEAKGIDTSNEETRCIRCRQYFTLDGRPVQ